MSETKQTDWVPWILAGVLAFVVWSGRQPATPPGPQPEPVPAVSIERETKQVLSVLKAEYAKVFSEAADRLEKGLLKTDKELFEFVRPATEAARKAANKPFDVAFELTLPRNDDGTFFSKEIEASAFLKRIAKSW